MSKLDDIKTMVDGDASPGEAGARIEKIEGDISSLVSAVDDLRVAPNSAGFESAWQPAHAILSATILCFIFFISLWFIYLMAKKGVSSGGLIRIITVPLVVVTGALLIVLGYGEKQVAPAFTLMGTLLGYLLGKGSKAALPPQDERGPDVVAARKSTQAQQQGG